MVVPLCVLDGAINETFVSVYNAGRMFEPDGDLDDIYGYAEIPDLSDPGKLLVVLDGGSPGAATCKLFTS